MSDYLFIRQAAVTVNDASGKGSRFPSLLPDGSPGFRVGFKIQKTSEAAPNKLDLEIYNLSKPSRALFETTGNSVLLEAGYADSGTAGVIAPMTAVFLGNIMEAKSEKRGTEWVTQVIAGDGESAYRGANVNVSFKEGTAIKEIIKTVVKSFKGVAIGKMEGLPDDATSNGAVLSGASRDVLDKLTDTYNLEWSIQDNEMTLTPKTRTPSNEIVLLTPQSGLLGPVVIKKKGTEGKAIEVTCLLRPEMKPTKFFSVQSNEISGQFLIRRVNHEGDTHGGAWKTMVEAQTHGSGY